MLKSLKISNFAIIKQLEINFSPKYNIITGETGAGKSIIIDALGLILGNRADTSVLRDKNKKCIVEAVFDIKKYDLKDFFSENDIDYFDETIIRREIASNGRSRAFINDTPVNLSILKDLGRKLIDIHSQNDNILLNDRNFQLFALDSYVKNFDLLQNYSKLWKNYKQLQKKFNELQQLAAKEKQDKDYYEFQLKQLQEANLTDNNELEELETEQRQLSHIEEIKNALSFISFVLNNDDNSVISNLEQAKNYASNIMDFFKPAEDIFGRLDSVVIELQDLANEVDILNADLELNPERLQFVNERINLIYSLLQKFSKTTIAELLELKQDFEDKLLKINSFDDEIEQLKKQIDDLLSQLNILADKISNQRKKAVGKFQDKINAILRDLGIENANFIVKIEEAEDLNPNGKDRVVFLFSANKNVEPQELSKVASGGEISRLMLALKFVIAETNTLPTIIFDEIDTGISGKIADSMGKLIKDLSQKIQIIQITHSPQIAAKGDLHIFVSKHIENDQTITQIQYLDKQARIKEIAKMISGDKLTDAALKAAEELLA